MAFRELKERFTKELVLIALNFDKKMRMEVDISDHATEEVLSMECEDGWWRPVAYSKSLNKMGRNYKIHDKEILVIIKRLENWRHLLEGAKFKFEVWTDYKNWEGKGIHTKEWEVEDGDNPVIPWCTSSRTWREMEDNGVGGKKLLVARSNKGYKKVCGWMWLVWEDKK